MLLASRTLSLTLVLMAANSVLAQGSGWRPVVVNPASNFEAAGVADFDGDGDLDIVCGDRWYEVGTWKQHRICDIPELGGYRVDFANVPMDVDGDGHIDVVSCNWHKQSVVWRRNPGPEGGEWKETRVGRPGNCETAIAADVDGDGRLDFLPDVAQRTIFYRVEEGRLVGHEISKIGGHGIGFGDVNGDGRSDILRSSGWLEAPVDRIAGEWIFHQEWNLGAAGIGILVHDFNSDGRADVFWGHGHDYGLSWLEQTESSNPVQKWIKRSVDKHWSQAHALRLVDLDADGKMEVLTGKRRYAHNGGDPGAEDGKYIFTYSFDTARNGFVASFIHRGEGDGLGLAPVVADLDGDGDLDIVAPGKGGLYVYFQERRGATSPDKTLATMNVPEGFEITLFASEPQIRKPIAFTFDERGRMVVAEAAEYPLGPKPGAKPSDTIKILEDTDGDGVADIVKVFADGLNIPDAVAVGHGGIYVAEAPNLWFMKDTDGDDRMDEKHAVITGFGTQDSHHLVHGLVWGPAGRLMMAQGCSTQSTIQTKSGPLRLAEGDFFRSWPDGSDLEVVFKSFTNSWGFDYDEFGNWFANDNEGPHLIHLREGGDYGLSLVRRRIGQPGVLPGMESDHAAHHGYLVMGGLTVYSGDAMPAPYRGAALQCSPNIHRVITDSLEHKASTFFAKQENDLYVSSDRWHRPIAITVGPDGAIYVLDWYNEILAHVEHPLDSSKRDKVRGRIFRIAWKGAPKQAVTDLRKTQLPGLIKNLRADNRWIRQTSQRLLAARGAEAVPGLLGLLNKEESPRTRCQALWTLEETRLWRGGKMRPVFKEAIRRSFSDVDPNVRAVALRFARRTGLADTAELRALLPGLAADPEAFVRYEVASAIAQLKTPLPLEKVMSMLSDEHRDDPFLEGAFASALLPYRDELLAQALMAGAKGLALDKNLRRALLGLRDERALPLTLVLLRIPNLESSTVDEVVTALRGNPDATVGVALVRLLTSRTDLPAQSIRAVLADLQNHKFADHTALYALLDALAAQRSGGVLRDVFLTAARVGHRGLAPRIVAGVNHVDGRVAEAAVLACGELQILTARAALVAQLKSAQGRARWALIRALSRVSNSIDDAPLFLKGLESPDSASDSVAGLQGLAQVAGLQVTGAGDLLGQAVARVAQGHVVSDHLTIQMLRAWILSTPAGATRSKYLAVVTAHEGVMRDWLLAGPFPNDKGLGHKKAYAPEQELKREAKFSPMGKEFGWQPMFAAQADGIVSLLHMQPHDKVVAYGWTTLQSKESRAATLFAGSDDSIKIWLNDQLVLDRPVDRGLVIDQERVEVTLRKGENTVLVKCGQNAGGWNFHTRIRTQPDEIAKNPSDSTTRMLYGRGSPVRGREIFMKSICAACHVVDGVGGRVGPDLSHIARHQPKSYIARAIVNPSADIAEGFGMVVLTKKDKSIVSGFIRRESATELEIVNAGGDTVLIAKTEIAERKSTAASGMPAGLDKLFAPDDLAHLMAFMMERR